MSPTPTPTPTIPVIDPATGDSLNTANPVVTHLYPYTPDQVIDQLYRATEPGYVPPPAPEHLDSARELVELARTHSDLGDAAADRLAWNLASQLEPMHAAFPWLTVSLTVLATLAIVALVVGVWHLSHRAAVPADAAGTEG